MGMVGGGPGSFIGRVHRMAAMLDGRIELVAGAFSSDPDKATVFGTGLGLAESRSYPSWETMLAGERALPEDERVDFVSVVTPNHLHFPVSYAFVQAGFNVVSDKPLATTVAEAERLVGAVERSGVVFAVTFNYTGYPLVKQARHLVQTGQLGPVRKVLVEYNQGWLARGLGKAWKNDPARAGAAGTLGDIGSHAENLLSTVTGLELESLCADLTTFTAGGNLDDAAAVLLRFTSGARGALLASQVATGEENNLRLRVYGTKGGLEWHQERPDVLHVKPVSGPEQLWRRGQSYLCAEARAASRLPPGHPEGFVGAFANLYRGVEQAVRARREGLEPDEGAFPTVYDGARAVRFVDAVVRSSVTDGWLKLR